MKVSNYDIHIRSAGKDDRYEILALLDKVFSENERSSFERGENYWKWKYESNVFGKSLLTVAEADGKLIGFDHLWPWQLNYKGITIDACEPCDSVVLKDYRGQGIFSKMRINGISRAKERNVKLLFNFPNENSLPANLKVGAVSLGRVPWRVKILKPFTLIKDMYNRELSAAAEIGDRYKLDVQYLDQIAAETVYKWEDDFIGVERKPGYHDWRYKQRPNRHYGMVSISKGNEAIAAIFTINKRGKVTEMVIVDILGHPGLSYQLYGKLVSAAKELEASFLALMENPRYHTNWLWRKGFIKKKIKQMVVLPIDMEIKEKVININKWSLWAGMHDSI